MRRTLENGETIYRAFSPANCTGYVATHIAFDGEDMRAMKNLFERHPSEFRAALTQLEMRFPENRVGGRSPEIMESRLATAEELSPGDQVSVNQDGKLQKAVPGQPYLGTLPPNTIVRHGFVQVPHAWMHEWGADSRQRIKTAADRVANCERDCRPENCRCDRGTA
ncbi:hypothetical protein NKI96_10695 [Mesorhizobium sp. M0292]|uniref:hypothetical protein n=1 Tax=Mesorhizobium sp. M0292 TaxID=2956929 RepID=UPI00333B8492